MSDTVRVSLLFVAKTAAFVLCHVCGINSGRCCPIAVRLVSANLFEREANNFAQIRAVSG